MSRDVTSRLKWVYSEYVRNRILSLANFNKSPTEIVRILSAENIAVVRSTVSKIIQRSREKEEGRQREDRRGRPAKATSPVKRKIDEVYRNDPEVTASELRNVLENELPDLRIGVSTIKRARKAAGWVCTKTRYCQMVREADYPLFHWRLPLARASAKRNPSNNW